MKLGSWLCHSLFPSPHLLMTWPSPACKSEDRAGSLAPTRSEVELTVQWATSFTNAASVEDWGTPGLLISCVQTQAKNMSCGWLFFKNMYIYIHHTSVNFQARLQTLSGLIQRRSDTGTSRAEAMAVQPEILACNSWEVSGWDSCLWLSAIAVMDSWH